MTELGVPMRRQLQQSSRERILEVTRFLAASSVKNLQIEVSSLADFYDVLLHGQF